MVRFASANKGRYAGIPSGENSHEAWEPEGCERSSIEIVAGLINPTLQESSRSDGVVSRGLAWARYRVGGKGVGQGEPVKRVWLKDSRRFGEGADKGEARF